MNEDRIELLLRQETHIRGDLQHKYLVTFNKEEFEDTKRVIRTRKSKRDRQHNDQKKRCKSTNNDLQNIHINLKIE